MANFSSYNKTYGSLAGVIIFLIWLWISNIAILLGAEFDAELERGRAIQGRRAGGPGALHAAARLERSRKASTPIVTKGSVRSG